MEFVALSDTVLRALALDDPQLRRVFQRRVPRRPVTQITPHDRPRGVHCQHRSSGGTRTTLVGLVDGTEQVRGL